MLKNEEEDFAEFLNEELGLEEREEEKDFNEYIAEYDELLHDEIEYTEAIVEERDVGTKWESKLQFNGKMHSMNVPIDIVKQTDLKKGDQIEWKIKNNNDDETIIQCRIMKEGYRVPHGEREEVMI